MNRRGCKARFRLGLRGEVVDLNNLIIDRKVWILLISNLGFFWIYSVRRLREFGFKLVWDLLGF